MGLQDGSLHWRPVSTNEALGWARRPTPGYAGGREQKEAPFAAEGLVLGAGATPSVTVPRLP